MMSSRPFFTQLAAVAVAVLLLGAYACGAETPAFQFNVETQTRQELVQVALGRDSADLIIRGANVLNAFTLQWEPDQDIVIKGQRIAWVGPAKTWPGKCENIVSATGEWAVPGFGESHKHIESTHVTPEYEAALVIAGGNTWTIDGTHEFGNVDGEHNVEFWLKARDSGSPFKHFVGLSSASPPTAYELGGGYYGYKEIRDNMAKDLRVVGLDEVMDWPSVANRDNPGYSRMWQVIQATWDSRGVVEGHGSGLVDFNIINAFSAAGLSSEHSVRFAEEGWNKLRKGVFIQITPGGIPAFIPHVVKMGLKDWSNISISTDDRDADDSLRNGTMDYNIRLAIQAGAPVEAAYAMASYYPARHWHLEHLVGSIAPGRHADVVLLKEDPKLVKVGRVFADGKLAAENGKYLLEVPKIAYPDWSRNTIKIGRTLTAADFSIAAPDASKKTAHAAILEPFWFNPDYITEELPVEHGEVQRDLKRFITKVAVIDRYHGKGVSKMFWRNAGPLSPDSAIACSYMHDIHNVWLFGTSDSAMALAANTLAAQGGGWVLVKGGKVTGHVTYEIGGVMTQRPAKDLAKEMEAFYTAADEVEWMPASPTSSRPMPPGFPKHLTLVFLTCTPWKWVLVAPNEKDPVGFVNVSNGQRHSVVW
jgi:adenine deaminase